MIAHLIALILGLLGAIGFAVATLELLFDKAAYTSPAVAGTAIASALCVVALAILAKGGGRG